MDGSPLCVRSPMKDINNTLFISNDLKRHVLSPQIFRKRFEIYSPLTELSLNLGDLSTTTPDSKNSSLNVTPKRKLELNDNGTPNNSPLAIENVVPKEEFFTTPLTTRTSNHAKITHAKVEKENGSKKSLGLHRLDSLRYDNDKEVETGAKSRDNPDDFDNSSQEPFTDEVKPSANMNILFRSPSKNNGTPVKSQMLDLSIMTPDSEKNETRVKFRRRRNLFRSVTFSCDNQMAGSPSTSGATSTRDDDGDDEDILGVAILSSIGNKRRSTGGSGEGGDGSTPKKSCCPDELDNSPSVFKKPMPTAIVQKPPLLRSQSEVFVKNVMNYADSNNDLIGDYSDTYALPSIVPARHQDLRNINVSTIVDLLNGQFRDVIDEYIIVDCRYPYEFNGGHIQGALNLYTKQNIVDRFLSPVMSAVVKKRTVVIFHCEFSSERGPKMFRFLRNRDRDLHKECYPDLYFPEIYLLAGGYKEFFETRQTLCVPNTYLPMLHSDYGHELRRYRSKKAKSWQGDKRRQNSRTGMGQPR